MKDWKYEVSNSGDYKSIRIGSKDKFINGDQQYVIQYRVSNAINFFKEHSELYFNLIGDKWSTTIDEVTFSVELYEVLPGTPSYFVATGSTGTKENNTITKWHENKKFSGKTTKPLGSNEGLTIGINFPNDFLVKQNYQLIGIYWILLPVLVLIGMFLIWRKWGKDEEVTIQTEYYPPENLSPGVAGYIINDKLDRRDLTALVPYWGAGGYLQIKEIEKSSLFGLIKTKEYEFLKLKDLPEPNMSFEKTLFNGIFASGKSVMLNDLKNVLYTTMNTARSQLKAEVDKGAYYEKHADYNSILLKVLGIGVVIYGVSNLTGIWQGSTVWFAFALIASGIIILIFGIFMTRKTRKGTALYQKLAGFKEFIQLVEKDRLQEFLKQDQHYFDKVLPYAIVFDVADKWKDKLESLNVPPPNWYVGNYRNYNTGMFMHSLDRSMNEMSKSFYSAPSGRGSSGGSFGGGGSSGGGFGGGGGSSW